MSFQSKKLHSFRALLRTMGVTSLITCKEALLHATSVFQADVNKQKAVTPLPVPSVCRLNTILTSELCLAYSAATRTAQPACQMNVRCLRKNRAELLQVRLHYHQQEQLTKHENEKSLTIGPAYAGLQARLQNQHAPRQRFPSDTAVLPINFHKLNCSNY